MCTLGPRQKKHLKSVPSPSMCTNIGNPSLPSSRQQQPSRLKQPRNNIFTPLPTALHLPFYMHAAVHVPSGCMPARSTASSVLLEASFSWAMRGATAASRAAESTPTASPSWSPPIAPGVALGSAEAHRKMATYARARESEQPVGGVCQHAG